MIQRIILLTILIFLFLQKNYGLNKETITNEQLIYLSNIHQFLENNAYCGRILVICEKTSLKSSMSMEDIDFLTKKKSLSNENKINILKDFYTSLHPGKDKFISKIISPKITYFSKNNGHRVVTFSCKKIHLGRAKLGFLLVPAKRCYIIEPHIIFH